MVPCGLVFTLVISWSSPTEATIMSLCATRPGEFPTPNEKQKANTLHEVDAGNIGLWLGLGRAVAMW